MASKNSDSKRYRCFLSMDYEKDILVRMLYSFELL